MNIIYFSRSYTGHDYRFVKELKKKFNIYYLSLEEDERIYESRSFYKNVHFINWTKNKKKKFDFKNIDNYIKELKIIISIIKPAYIHAGPTFSCSYIAAKSKGKIPLITVSWGFDILRDIKYSKKKYNFTRFSLDKSAHLICDSNIIKKKVLIENFISKTKVSVFPWGVDNRLFKDDRHKIYYRKKYGFNENDILLIHNRSWEDNPYNIMIALEAFKLVSKKNKYIKLILIGDGSKKIQVMKYIKDNNLQKKIMIVGFLTKPTASFYQIADIYYSCSIVDGSSISLLEALSCKLPVVIPYISGNKYWIDLGIKGNFYRNINSREVFKNLNKMIHNLDKTNNKYARNRRITLKYANWSKNKKNILSIYRNIKKNI